MRVRAITASALRSSYIQPSLDLTERMSAPSSRASDTCRLTLATEIKKFFERSLELVCQSESASMISKVLSSELEVI